MRIKRSLPILLGVVIIAAALSLIVQLRKHAPPEAARLLPGADAFLYVNLKWIRSANAVSQLPPVSHDPEYERFIQETGFQFERDLDEAAFAVHYPAAGAPPERDGSPAPPRFSEVFVGKIQGEKLIAYLRKLSSSVEEYHSREIFSIPLEGRTVRVAILGVDAVAISNHENPNVIRGMVERARKLASPFGGPALLRQYYKHVPLASLAWVIARVQPANGFFLAGPISSWSMLFPKPADVVVSARYIRALHLRAEAFTDSDEDAQNVADKVGTFLSIFHAAESAVGTQGTDPDVKSFFESLKIERSRDRAILTAVLPPAFFRKALTEAPQAATPSTQVESGPSPSPQKPPAKPVQKRPPPK
jgi:hypothetical protein